MGRFLGTLTVGANPVAVAFDGANIWVTNIASNNVTKLHASDGMIGIEMYARTRRIHSGMADEMIRMAAEQFLPSVGAGALITLALVRYVPAVLWMLPGLWQIVFSLGVFSSCRFLPRPHRAWAWCAWCRSTFQPDGGP